MHAPAGERVEVGRHGGDERLSLTGLHLGDVALVEHDGAHDLDVEVALAEGSPGGLPHQGERLREDLVELLALRDLLPEPVGTFSELGFAELLDLVLERVDQLDVFVQPLQLAALAHGPQPLKTWQCHSSWIQVAITVRAGPGLRL